MDTWYLDTLPDDVLLIIFGYCDMRDFTRLGKVCKRFHDIVRRDVVWKRHYKKLLVTNQVSEQFRKRCNLLLPSYSKYFISQNWVQGRYQQHVLLKRRGVTYPWLQLTSDKLWWHGHDKLYGFDRQEQNTLRKLTASSIDKSYSDNYLHGRFIIWRGYIMSGTRNGILLRTESPVKKFNGYNKCIIKKRLIIHNKPLQALDATSNIIVSAASSKPADFALIRIDNSLDIDSINMNNIVRKKIPGCRNSRIDLLAINPLETSVSGYDSAHGEIFSIDLEHDLEFKEIVTLSNETMDILWEDSNTLLMCTSDDIQKWDFRVNDCVSTWHYPYMKTLCISSDHHNTIITGASDARATLWDQRMRNYVQRYLMQPPAKCCWQDNQIFSLQFDSTKLYCATNRYLYEVDFSVRKISHVVTQSVAYFTPNFFVYESNNAQTFNSIAFMSSEGFL